MAYTAWSVVFGEQPTAAKWNQLGANDAGFKDATNIDALAIKFSHIDTATFELFKTTEVIIGKWTDGRPVYRKVISLGSGPNATSKSVAHGITNLDLMVNMYGSLGGRTLPIAPTSTASTSIIGTVRLSGADLVWYTTYNATGEVGTAILEYVKT